MFAHASPPSLSIVVPCFNEEEVLGEMLRRVSGVARDTVGDSYEVLLVDDGSGDQTWARIASAAEEDDNVIGIRLSRNHGHQLALTAGLHLCCGERVLVLDADLQDPPELLPEMMRLMDDGADVVYGQRAQRDGETVFKKSSAALFYRFLNALTDVSIPMDTGDFRLMSRRALFYLNNMPERHRFVRGMVSWVGLKQVPLSYHREERFAGETKYPLRKMLRFAVDAITAFSTVPLRAASYLGLVFGLLGFAAIIYTLYSWLFLNTVAGWTSVMTVVLVLGSTQLLLLGVFGEYLGRLFEEAKRRPLYLIGEVVGTGINDGRINIGGLFDIAFRNLRTEPPTFEPPPDSHVSKSTKDAPETN